MLAINVNGFVEEDCVVILFPYTFEGFLGLWYFLLPSRSITSWDISEEKFLTKFGDDRTTTTLIMISLILKQVSMKKSRILILDLINSSIKSQIHPNLVLMYKTSGIYLPYLQISHFLSIRLIKRL